MSESCGATAWCSPEAPQEALDVRLYEQGASQDGWAEPLLEVPVVTLKSNVRGK